MREKLIQIVADTLGFSPEDLGDAPSMDTVSAWDSVAHLNVVMSVEQEFGVRLTTAEIAQARSVDAFAEILRTQGK